MRNQVDNNLDLIIMMGDWLDNLKLFLVVLIIIMCLVMLMANQRGVALFVKHVMCVMLSLGLWCVGGGADMVVGSKGWMSSRLGSHPWNKSSEGWVRKHGTMVQVSLDEAMAHGQSILLMWRARVHGMKVWWSWHGTSRGGWRTWVVKLTRTLISYLWWAIDYMVWSFSACAHNYYVLSYAKANRRCCVVFLGLWCVGGGVNMVVDSNGWTSSKVRAHGIRAVKGGWESLRPMVQVSPDEAMAHGQSTLLMWRAIVHGMNCW
jgi:hypothetical protein